MNCRDPTATLSVVLPSVTADVLKKLRTSIHVVDDFRFQWVPLSSDSGVGNVEVLQKSQHQDWVAHSVTIVHEPLIRQASALLQRVLRIMGTGVLFWVMLEVC